MSRRLDFVLRANSDYLEQQFARYRQDPASVPEEWALFFAGFELGEQRDAAPAGGVASVGGVYGLVVAYREFGHLLARLDPLGEHDDSHPLLELGAFGLSEADLDREVDAAPFRGEFRGTLRQLIEALRETYCGTLGVEYMEISDTERREWLQERMERTRNRPALSTAERLQILRQLLTADAFEQFLHVRYAGQKRFSLEGASSLIPMLETLIRTGAAMGVEQMTIGMTHRGRLNVLANVLHKPLEQIFSEFESITPADIQGHGDVKYHLGYSSARELPDGRSVHLDMHYNPSHLEFVNPVVLGAMRARQDRMADAGREHGVPVLIHGDAAFSGEGIVPEGLALVQLPAYVVGGTLHLIVNNQIGFTTSPADARVTRYPTAIARAFDAPVLHVNGDDPEAAVHAITLAVEYRARFRRDVILDVVCYRKHGHNEMDDPTFTQPVMYRKIAAHVPAARQYADALIAAGLIDAAGLEKLEKEIDGQLRAAHQRERSEFKPRGSEPLGGSWQGLEWAGADWSADTAVPRATLEQVLNGITELPAEFHPHRKITQLNLDRRKMLEEDRIDWGLGEALAYGSLLLEGRNVRLTGQDVGRGTFTHRHATLFDSEDGHRLVPLEHLAPEQGRFDVVDTMLSEAAVLGFEYGYSTADPHTLTVWEAQFGDFANVAQVYIDQFLASAESKWRRMSGLTLLLPHGYEGQGPEHSSARLERFLELCANGNMQVCNLTTPAQFFHALRRQLHRKFRKPLVVMSPKSLLRHKLAVSAVNDFENGGFRTLIEDTAVDVKAVRRVLFTSGRFYYTLLEARAARSAEHVAIVRIEQFYPFPAEEVKRALAKFPKVTDIRWVQEEPANMGAWRHLRHRFEAVLPANATLRMAARKASPTPATGFYALHQEQEQALLEQSLGESEAPAPWTAPRPADAPRGASR